MITISLLLFFSSIVCVYLGFYVMRLNRQASLNRVFFLLCLCFGVWGFSYSYVISAPTKEIVWFWFRLSSLGWCTFGGITLHFFLVLSHRDTWLKKWWVYAVLYVPGLLLVYRVFTGFVTAHDFVRHSLGWYEIQVSSSPWYWLHLLNFSLCILTGLGLTYLWGKKSTNYHEKRQASIVVGTGIIAFILGCLTNIVLPVLGKIELPAIAPVIILVWVFGIWYAIVKYELMTLTSEIAAQEIMVRVMDLLITVNPGGRITSANQRILDLLGYTKAELTSLSIHEIIVQQEAIDLLMSTMRGDLPAIHICFIAPDND